MSIKCVVSDFDGTLVHQPENYTGLLDASTIRFIQKLKAKDVQFVVASGRDHYTGRFIGKQLGFDIDAIGNNGATVLVQDKLIVNHTLPWEWMLELVNTIKTHPQLENILFTDSQGNHVFQRNTGWLFERFGYMVENGEVSKRATMPVENWVLQSDVVRPNKAVVATDNRNARDNISAALDEFVDRYDLTKYFSSHQFIEVMPKNVNKATGVLALAQYYGYHPDEIVVAGDSYNDVFMLEAFKHSYVMSHADKEVIAKGKVVVESIDQVLEAVLKQF